MPMTLYFLFEASSVCSMGHSLKDFIELKATSVLIVIFFPFSVRTVISFSFSSFLGQYFSSKASIFCLSSLLNTLPSWNICCLGISQFFSEILVHLCFNCKLAQVWQLGTQFVYFYTHEWSDGQLTSCPLVIGHFLCQSSFAYWWD